MTIPKHHNLRFAVEIDPAPHVRILHDCHIMQTTKNSIFLYDVLICSYIFAVEGLLLGSLKSPCLRTGMYSLQIEEPGTEWQCDTAVSHIKGEGSGADRASNRSSQGHLFQYSLRLIKISHAHMSARFMVTSRDLALNSNLETEFVSTLPSPNKSGAGKV